MLIAQSIFVARILCHLPDLSKGYKLPMNVLRLEMGSLQITQGHRFGNKATIAEMGGNIFNN